jgi:hypothetical protein
MHSRCHCASPNSLQQKRQKSESFCIAGERQPKYPHSLSSKTKICHSVHCLCRLHCDVGYYNLKQLMHSLGMQMLFYLSRIHYIVEVSLTMDCRNGISGTRLHLVWPKGWPTFTKSTWTGSFIVLEPDKKVVSSFIYHMSFIVD